ncbi:MAG TPA: tRNA (adenosine(37)-N6)-threonylcarbamoyltransferase complex dimerization subunit type 1 TsaB [Rhizobiaceae bacterium]|nr:tRNA (adenosine(37)-N6)-threonylcarbamoyltransferase complex dimerization subunit type 1 TsaB [Rhizobiaceae bacterium]
MKLLAVDSAASLCAACVWDTAAGHELGRSVTDIGKGHAERLMATIAEALHAAGAEYSDLGGLAVSTGPGSFTGVRVGVSTIRGLALALKIPAIGITTLEAVAAEGRIAFPGRDVLVAIDAGRGDLYVALYDASGTTSYDACVLNFADAVSLAVETAPVLCGTAAAKIAQAASPLALDTGPQAATADIATFARLAAQRGASPERPAPVYLREPDAKPQAGFILPRSRS